MSNVIIVIPARYGSTRLPAKPLLDLAGQPMIQRVYELAKKARGIARVVVATDDERIASVVRGFQGEVCLTSPDLASGTDRVAQVAQESGYRDADIYVNLQGDEPLIDPVAIEKAVELIESASFDFSTVMVPIRSWSELKDPSVVKVISDARSRAIYFSRHPIPYSRGELPQEVNQLVCRRHVGLYAYRRSTLLTFSKLPSSGIEKAEVLEQLRALEAGIPIGIAHVDCLSLGVDTAEDLEKVRQLLV
ncbi:MAG: 3-deoxy-manno-octulosonate cytidylyltransferase [Bdellovibrionia bacterium]